MSHSHMDFGLPCTLANGYTLWEAELRSTLRYLSKLSTKEPLIYKELIKKCIYPEYNLSKTAITILENFKLILESPHTVETGIYSFDTAKNVILSEFKKLGIDNIQQLQEVLRTQTGPSGIDAILMRLKENLKGYAWKFPNPPGDLVTIIATKVEELEKKEIKRKLFLETLNAKTMTPVVDAHLSTKILEYLSQHKQTIFIAAVAAVAGYGLYDYYHENRIGKFFGNFGKKKKDQSEITEEKVQSQKFN